MILVCGEALVDILVASDAEPGRIAARFGGAPLNVAIGLARLGVPSAFLGGLSSDPVGMAILALLSAEGVDTRFVRRTDAPSMLAMASLSRDGVASYSFPIHDGAEKQLPAVDSVMPSRADLTCAVFSSFLAFRHETAPLLHDLASRLRPSTLICLDPNVRLALLPDPGAWKRGLEAFLPLVDVIKASDDDVRLIYGDDASPADVAMAWLAQGASAVCITRGARGANLYRWNSPAVSMPAPAVAIVDTVGAGDSFLAGLLAFLSHAGRLSRDGLGDHARLEAAMSYAIAAAALTCQRQGADLPRLRDLPLEFPA